MRPQAVENRDVNALLRAIEMLQHTHDPLSMDLEFAELTLPPI